MQVTIFHVDDDPFFRQSFRKTMEQKGINVRSHADSESASKDDLSTSDLKVGVVDSVGAAFLEKLRQICPQCRTILLSSSTCGIESEVDAVVSKKDLWYAEINACLNRFVREDSIRRRQIIDLFSDDSNRDKYRGKIVILGGHPEEILAVCSSSDEVTSFLRTAKVRCRIVQGPPANELSLAELLG